MDLNTVNCIECHKEKQRSEEKNVAVISDSRSESTTIFVCKSCGKSTQKQQVEEVYTVRSYTDNDHDQIIPLWVSVTYSNLHEYIPKEEHLLHSKYYAQQFQGDFSDMDAVYFNRGGHFWVVTGSNQYKDKVVGMVGLEVLDSKTVELRRMGVDQNFRRKGIAQKLMQAFEKYVVDNKYQQIVLSTLVENIPGRKFYESIGFKLVKEGKYPNEIRVAYYCKEFLI